MTEEYELILACLLHDIGKINQRVMGGNHANIGGKFVENLVNIPEKSRKVVMDLVSNHHNEYYNGPSLDILNILKLADRKSAGHDRTDRDSISMSNKEFFMVNPFSAISKESLKLIYGCEKSLQNISEREELLPIARLSSLSEIIYGNFLEGGRELKAENRSLDNPKKSMDEIWNDLKRDLMGLQFYEGNWRQYINNILNILEEYTRLIPSAYYYSYPTVSLYDHLKLTSALALSLYRGDRSNPSFLLIGGEFQGIQNYIFRKLRSEGSDEGMARRLRGRSFSIYLLTELVTLHLLRALNLYRFNVISTAGGKFWIIAPYSNENLKKLEKAREEIDEFFIREHRGINLSLAWEKFNFNDLLEEDESGRTGKEFRKLTSPVVRKIEERKNKIGLEIINVENYESIFFPDKGSPVENNDLCGTCGIRLTATNENKCQICFDEEEIGRYLVKRSEIIVTADQLEGKSAYKVRFGDSTYYSYLVESGEYYEKSNDKMVIEIIRINKYDKRFHKSGDYGYLTLHNSTYAPRSHDHSESVKTFEEMAESEKSKDSNKKYLPLGLIKMDLDNFSVLSISPVQNFTISKYATQSFLTLFLFSELIDRVAKKYEVYIVYSEGDDVIVIGKVTRLFGFVGEFRKMISAFTSNRLSISAGLTTFNRKMPPRLVIEMAEENLEKSKSVDCKKDGTFKNSITLFDRTMGWNEYFEMEMLGETLADEINSDNLAKEFLYHLIELDERNPYLKENFVRGKEIVVPDPHVYYYLNRNYSKGTEDKSQRDKKINELMEKIISKKNYKHIRVAANIAAYITKDLRGD